MFPKKHLLPMVLPLALIAACGGGGSTNNGTSSFSLAVSDAPVDDLKEVVVCFNQIELKRDGGDVIFTVGEDENVLPANDLCRDNSDNIIPNTVGIDLLEYTGAASIDLVGTVDIPAGTYSQMRLKIADGSYGIDAATDEKIGIKVPSNELKLDSFVATVGSTVDFTLEFDLRKGMTNPVGQDTYTLKPRGVRLVDNNESGHITGTVTETLLLNNSCTVNPSDLTEPVATVYLYTDADLAIETLEDNMLEDDLPEGSADPLASTVVTFDGQAYNFEIGFVQTGSYTIALSCDLVDDPEVDDAIEFISSQNVTVTEGDTADVTFDVPVI